MNPNELQQIIQMRALVIAFFIFLAYSLDQRLQNRLLRAEEHKDQTQGQNESFENENSNYLSSLSEKQDSREAQSQRGGNHSLSTKGTILALLIILSIMVIKKCFKCSNLSRKQQTQYLHQNNKAQQDVISIHVDNQQPILINFDLEQMKSKYLVQNYGVRASRLNQTCSQPIILMS